MGEYERGKRFAKEYYSQFRSYSKDANGRIIGHKRNGSRVVIGTLAHHKSNEGFLKGTYDVLKSEVFKKKTKTRRRNGVLGLPTLRF